MPPAREVFAVPYRRFTVTSSLAPDALSRRVAAVTEDGYRWFRLPPPNIRFVGRVTEKELRLVPVIRGRNTYAPWVNATLTPADAGTTLDVRMTLHPVAITVMLAFFLFVSRLPFTWWPLAVFGGFHVVMYWIGFRPEANRVERVLRELAA